MSRRHERALERLREVAKSRGQELREYVPRQPEAPTPDTPLELATPVVAKVTVGAPATALGEALDILRYSPGHWTKLGTTNCSNSRLPNHPRHVAFSTVALCFQSSGRFAGSFCENGAFCWLPLFVCRPHAARPKSTPSHLQPNAKVRMGEGTNGLSCVFNPP
jgi:hypothetical protein